MNSKHNVQEHSISLIDKLINDNSKIELRCNLNPLYLHKIDY